MKITIYGWSTNRRAVGIGAAEEASRSASGTAPAASSGELGRRRPAPRPAQTVDDPHAQPIREDGDRPRSNRSRSTPSLMTNRARAVTAQAVGEQVEVPGEVLDAVRAGVITPAEAARRALDVKTTRRRPDAAAVV